MMKRFFFTGLILALLALCACGNQQGTPLTTQPQDTTATAAATAAPTEVETTQPESTAAPTTQAPVNTEVSSAYIEYADDEPDGALGVVLNEPFDGSEPAATISWIDGEYDRAYVVPKYPGSTVSLYELLWDEEGAVTRSQTPVYELENCEDGCVIYGAFMRPEGAPLFYLEVTAPNGAVYGYEMSYNGNTGTPAREYLCN